MDIHTKEIQKLQQEISEKQKKLNQLILSQEPEVIKNYFFKDVDGNDLSLDALFGDKEELLLIHNMGKSCVYCTMWADTLSGSEKVINDRVKMVLTSPDNVSTMKNFKESRNWNLDCFSYDGTDFSVDLGFAEDVEGRRWFQPGFSVLIKKEGQIYRTAKDVFGPGDAYCAPWHLFALLPKSEDNWQPKYNY